MSAHEPRGGHRTSTLRRPGGGRRAGRTEQYAHELRRHLRGFGLATALTLAPFAAVGYGWLSGGTALALIGVCAVAQIVVQFRYFLHIDLSRQSREDLQLILFTFLILLIMISGTVWILASQYDRMM